MHLEKESHNFLIGATLGCVLGAATALLLTPVSGKSLRKNILQEVKKGEYRNTILASPPRPVKRKTHKSPAKASKRARAKVPVKTGKR